MKLEAGIEARLFGPEPDAGVYYLVAISGKFRTAKTGTRGYNMHFAVLDGPQKGRKFFDTLWFTDGMKNKLLALRSACGSKDLAIDDEDESTLVAAFLNKPFKAEVAKEEFRGSEQTKLKFPVSRNNKSAFTEDDEKTLAAFVSEYNVTGKWDLASTETIDTEDVPF